VGLVASVAIVAASLAAIDRWVRGSGPLAPSALARTGDRAPGAPLPKLWPLPPLRGVTQDGRDLTTAALRERAWVADFIYTRCTSACPMLTARMVVLGRKLHPAVGFLSFSVDPSHDSPEVLAAYAHRWSIGERPWTLLAMKAPDVDALAEAMQVVVDRPAAGDGDIIHSDHFFLVDRDGWVRAVYDSQSPAALDALARDAEALAGGRTPTLRPAASLDGAQLFGQLGCGGCHTNARVAPPLGGFQGRVIQIEGGAAVSASDDYLRESLVSPSARLVAGYPPTMPSYRGVLDDAQLTALVKYLQELPAPAATPAATTAVDPMCGMRVVVRAETPRLERDGAVSYFCSETCRDRFQRRASAARHGARRR
jgi:protein SCO1/2